MEELKKDEKPYDINTSLVKKRSVWTISVTPEDEEELNKREYDDFDKRVTRLGFIGNPYKTDSTLTGLYYIKPAGLPEPILKRISTTDSLVGSILLSRQKQVSQFGRRQEDRLSLGFGLIPDKRVFDKMSKEDKEDIERRIEKACKLLETCGKTDGWLRTERMNLSRWLEESARSALIVGRIATEIIVDDDGLFHSFRPLDAGTIFPTVKTASAPQLQDIRERSTKLLQSIYGGKAEDYIDSDGSLDWDRYEWIQLLDGRAIQCFTDEQLRSKNFYPVGDFEWSGFPVTPLDLAINEVLTHISITAHNKLFFQSGRAARGMIIIQSDDVDAQVLLQIRNEFMAAVNSVSNSHRMPVFGIGPEDKLTWQPIDNSSRDMEYQYLSDNNARAILSAFQMSPEELPGYAHLSRGTNNQSLSECVGLNSRVYQINGYNTIGSILGDKEEVYTEIWDGRQYTKCRIFKSGLKKSIKTILNCGIGIITSPDHKFMTIDGCGNLQWKTQENLSTDDYILVSKSNTINDNTIPQYNGKGLSLDMMEYIGWIIGDGTIVAPRKRSGGYIVSFYQPHNELEIRDMHEGYCNSFGIKFDKKDKILTNKEKTKLKDQFNSVSDVRILGYVRDTKFVRWLMSLGFNPSSRKIGKNIPSFVYTLPLEYRCAFLRGLFSADGGKLSTKNHIALTCQNDTLRDQVRHLLLSIGIRTNSCKGVNRFSFGKKKLSYKLYIKDRDVFWKNVGFVQKHKQFEGDEKTYINKNNKDLPKSLINNYLKKVIDNVPKRSSLLDKRLRSNINTVLHSNRSCTLSWLKSIESITSIPLPVYLNDFYVEKVANIVDLNSIVEMADVEMFNESHGFIAEGFYVHNSNKEYLLEAHRDTGIRPLLINLEEFIDQEILPLIDPILSKVVHFKLLGLDAKTLDQEDADATRNLSLDGSINHVREIKQRPLIPKRLAGDLPLNQAWWAVVQQMVPFGEIQEVMFGIEGASKDPTKQFYQNPFWFQYQTMLLQQKQLEAQAQQAQQQPQPGNK